MINTVPNAQGQFDIEYFNREIVEFRKLFGTRSFMEDEAKQEIAIKALAFVYTNVKTTTPAEEQRVRETFTWTMDEFNKRKSMIALLPLRQALGLTRSQGGVWNSPPEKRTTIKLPNGGTVIVDPVCEI